MKLFVMLLTLFAGFSAHATTFEVDPFNYQMRFERTEDQGLQNRNFWSAAVGMSWGTWGALAEYGRFSTRSGSAYANFGRDHEEVIVWGRGEIPLWEQLSGVGGAGLGFARDTVDTHFGEDRAVDHGDRTPIYGVSAGLAYDPIPLIRFGLDGRLLFSQGFDPNPQPDVVLRAGVRF